jgi:hypothetical protein
VLLLLGGLAWLGLVAGTAVGARFVPAGSGLAAWRFATVEAERRATAGIDVPLPPPAGFRIESRISEADDMRRYRELTVDADTWTATWTAVGPEAATCTTELIFDEADALLGKRAEIRDSHDRFTSLCPAAGSATHVYALHESDPGAPSWELTGDFECLQRNPEVAEPHQLLGRIPIDAVSRGRTACGS